MMKTFMVVVAVLYLSWPAALAQSSTTTTTQSSLYINLGFYSVGKYFLSNVTLAIAGTILAPPTMAFLYGPYSPQTGPVLIVTLANCKLLSSNNVTLINADFPSVPVTHAASFLNTSIGTLPSDLFTGYASFANVSTQFEFFRASQDLFIPINGYNIFLSKDSIKHNIRISTLPFYMPGATLQVTLGFYMINVPASSSSYVSGNSSRILLIAGAYTFFADAPNFVWIDDVPFSISPVLNQIELPRLDAAFPVQSYTFTVPAVFNRSILVDPSFSILYTPDSGSRSSWLSSHWAMVFVPVIIVAVIIAAIVVVAILYIRQYRKMPWLFREADDYTINAN